MLLPELQTGPNEYFARQKWKPPASPVCSDDEGGDGDDELSDENMVMETVDM